MSFREEWARARAEAATRTRLDHADGVASSGGPSDLIVRQDDLGRIGHAAFMLHGRLKKAGDITRGAEDEGATAKAAAALTSHNFAMGAALTTTATVWGDQLRTLLQACAHVSNHLDYTKRSHAAEDAKIAASLGHRDGSAVSVSEISKYYR
ncbi:hypothetical protein ACQUSR_23575 [Streptomyces sp. P1-3]|uniref:hypothetical protein n=1 Tax=Streptomyces sp. P1-3 TaxID=3421658 RepID=UPI003D36E882